MNTRSAQMGFISLALMVAAAGTAHGDWVANSGAACQQTGISYYPEGDLVVHDGDGSFSWSDTLMAQVTCPLTVGRTSTAWPQLSQIILRYADRSSSAWFRCRVEQTTWNGSYYYGSYKYTCSAGGGCADPDASYTGVGNYLLWQGSELGGISNLAVDSNTVVYCDLPPSTPSARSVVISYYAQ